MKLVIKFDTLDELKDRLTELQASFHKSETAAKEVIEKAAKKPAPTQVGAEPAPTQPATEEAAAPAGQPIETTSAATASPSEPAYTVEQVREVCLRLKEEGKNSAAVIKQFGSSLSAIPTEKYPDLLAALEAL